MKKSLFVLIFLSLSFFGFAFGTSDAKNSNRLNEVIVYSYDSFVSEWGAGPVLQQKFKEKTGLDLVLISVGDASKILSRAILEKNDVQADVLLGIDNNMLDIAYSSGVFECYKAQGSENIREDLSFCDDYLLTPFDWSYFALIYDTESEIPKPTSLQDLTKECYKNKLILMNPMMSTPGLGFVAWTYSVFGEKYEDFWKNLKSSILTMAPSWSTGYGLFKNGEAPLVISYTTSPAYHVEYENSSRYQALIFDEGHVMQIEGVGLAKNAPNKEGAKLFIDFLISEDAQNVIPLTQWMYPVNKNAVLPESFEKASPYAKKALHYDAEKLNTYVEKAISILQE